MWRWLHLCGAFFRARFDASFGFNADDCTNPGRKSAMAPISKTTRRDSTEDKTQTVRINWINVNVRQIECLFPISPALHTISIRSSSGTLTESQCHAHACQISSIDVKLIRVMRPAIVNDLMSIWHHYTHEIAYTDGAKVCWAKKWLLQ